METFTLEHRFDLDKLGERENQTERQRHVLFMYISIGFSSKCWQKHSYAPGKHILFCSHRRSRAAQQSTSVHIPWRNYCISWQSTNYRLSCTIYPRSNSRHTSSPWATLLCDLLADIGRCEAISVVKWDSNTYEMVENFVAATEKPSTTTEKPLKTLIYRINCTLYALRISIL